MKRKRNKIAISAGLMVFLALLLPRQSFSQSTVFTVPPEIPTHVLMSASGLNRITCPGAIRDVTTEEESGLMVTYTETTAIVKFPILQRGSDRIYADKPTEIIAVCNDQIFSLIVTPKKITAPIIQLTRGTKNRVEENRKRFEGLAIEEKIVEIIKTVYKEAMPRSFKIKSINQTIALFRDIGLTHLRTISIDGEGFIVKEFTAQVVKGEQISWDEKEFLCALVSDEEKRQWMGIKPCQLPSAATKPQTLLAWPIGITVDKHHLKRGEVARILVIEDLRER